MSDSGVDKTYSDLCETFKERARSAKLLFDTSENEIFDDDENCALQNLLYSWTVGIRSNSELLWVMKEEALYVSNGKILGNDEEAYTCYIKNCKGRVYLKQNGIAFKVAEHTVNHGSMYKLYVEMQCREQMREDCRNAGASKSIGDIYDDAVIR